MPPFEEIVVVSEAASSAADPVPCLTKLRSEIEPQLLPTPVDVSSIPENESMLSVLTRQDNESSNIDLSFQTSSESENDESSSTKTLNDNWLTCAGELSYLVEDLRRASDLVEEVKGDNCPVVETFLINAEELAQRICKNANKIWRLSNALLRDIRENKKDLVSSAEANVASVPSHDPSERCNVKTSAEKKYLIKLGPHQPKFSVFPKHDNIPKRKQCRFSSVWYTAFPHLEYSISKDAAFCYVCSLFPSGPGREQADNAWSTDGVRQWHKMTSRGKGKEGKLAVHFASKSHKAALADFYAFSQQSSNVDLLLDKEKRANIIQAEKDKLTNSDAVSILFDVAGTLARQGISFRGRSTESTGKDDEIDGNFNQTVQLVSRHCPSLKRWLDEVRLRPYHVTYMSHDSQNEMIDILANNIRRKVKEEVDESKMYSVLADTTPDTSNKDRLAVAVRYVKEDGPSFEVKERLLEVKEATDKTGRGQASDILQSLENSGLKSSELVFQSYDFAYNMSGVHNGARAEVEKILDRKVPYIPCQAHRCNTVVEHSCESSHIIQELFNILQELYVFFSGSTKRHAVLAKHLKTVENCLQLGTFLKQDGRHRWNQSKLYGRLLKPSFKR